MELNARYTLSHLAVAAYRRYCHSSLQKNRSTRDLQNDICTDGNSVAVGNKVLKNDSQASTTAVCSELGDCCCGKPVAFKVLRLSELTEYMIPLTDPAIAQIFCAVLVMDSPQHKGSVQSTSAMYETLSLRRLWNALLLYFCSLGLIQRDRAAGVEWTVKARKIKTQSLDWLPYNTRLYPNQNITVHVCTYWKVINTGKSENRRRIFA